MAIVVNKPLPEFEANATSGVKVSNTTHVGKTMVLYFYPKDNTPGCTTESCDFRDAQAELTAAGAQVLGLSPDSLKSHQGFIAKQSLNFPLLADEEHALSEALGVWVEKSMYGRTYMGIERSTFLIDGNGTVAVAWPKVTVKGHVDAVLAAAQAL